VVAAGFFALGKLGTTTDSVSHSAEMHAAPAE
jgi:hypothetical protein